MFGIPQGLNNLATQNALYYQADLARFGSSSGLLRTSTHLGAIGAAAITSAFFDHIANTAGLHRISMFFIIVAGLYLALEITDRSLLRIGRDAFGPEQPRD